VSSATLIVTKRNIAEREAQVLKLRAALRKLPPKSPKHKAIVGKIKELLTELAALRASLHYYKPTRELAAAIDSQRKAVHALTAALRKARGPEKTAVGKQLRAAAKTLNEMLAAAKAQQMQVGLQAPLPAKGPALTLVSDAKENPVGTEEVAEVLSEVAAGAEEVDAGVAVEGFQPSEFSLTDIPDYAETALERLGDSFDKLDDYRDEEGQVWYKNPIVLVGAGTAVWLLLRRRS